MKYYVTYPGNTITPWLADATVDIEASTKEEALSKFMGNGYKNIKNCIRVSKAGEMINDYRHPMTALWEDSMIQDGQFQKCIEEKHWLQWVEKQHHQKYTIDQYNPFIPMKHELRWPFKLATFCCTCGVIVHKEEGESGVPEKPMVAWYLKKQENYPGKIHG